MRLKVNVWVFKRTMVPKILNRITYLPAQLQFHNIAPLSHNIALYWFIIARQAQPITRLIHQNNITSYLGEFM